jgi:hypothetical protein
MDEPMGVAEQGLAAYDAWWAARGLDEFTCERCGACSSLDEVTADLWASFDGEDYCGDCVEAL